MSFQEELSKLRDRVSNLPTHTAKVLHDATAELVASGIEDGVAKVGAVAPSFTLGNHLGETRSSDALRQGGPLVVCFYRGFWCSFCNADLANLNKFLPEIEAAGAKLVALSPEKPEYSKRIIRRRKLDFEILTDLRNEAAAGFGLRYSLGESLKELYRDTLNINLKLYHGDDDWTLPMPARFLVDANGIIRYAEASADYTRRPDPEDLLQVLESL